MSRSKHLLGWLLKIGEGSTILRTSVKNFVGWIANGSPPWAANREFMPDRLIALDEHPGVHPVGVGEMWRRLFVKIILKVTVLESTMAFQDDQLCAGTKAGIDGAIHEVQALWEENSSMEKWDFLLVDAKNAFNEINQVVMLWTVRHLWSSISRFSFNCYRHWSSLVLRNGNGMASILHSRESVKQGGTLGMIA